MPTPIDFMPLMNVLGRFWQQHKDLPIFKVYWEGLIRSADDLWLQQRQVAASRFLATTPSFIASRFLYRELPLWKDTGVFHRHFKTALVAGPNQAIFYPGVFLDPDRTRIYLEGKMLDAQGGDFYITYEQDATQPGVNPRGSRVILHGPVPAGAALVVSSDRETFWIDHTFATPTTALAFTYPANPLSIQAIIESVDITSEVLIDVAGVALSFRDLSSVSPSTTDARLFRRGETVRVVDVVVGVQDLHVTADTAVLTIPVPVAPTAQVLRIINLDVSAGKVVLEADKVSVPDQSFSPNTKVRVIDALGAQTFDVTAPVSTITLDRPVNPDEAEVTYLSGSVFGGMTISATGVSFRRSFQRGVRLSLYGDYHLGDHDHASYHVDLDAPSDRASVPDTRPWVLSPTLTELPEYPIEVYVDGMLQPPSKYKFVPLAETYSIRFMNGLVPNVLPTGTKVDFFYVDQEDNRLHKHVNDRFVTVEGQASFELTDSHSQRYPLHLTVDGVLQNDPDNYAYTMFRDFLHVTPPMPSGSIVHVRGEKLELAYTVDVDTDIEQKDFVEADLPVSRLVYARYLQDGIEKGPYGAALTKLSPYTTVDAPVAGFSLTPIQGSLCGFTLKSSSIIEDAWFETALVDEATAWRNFGAIIDLERGSSDAYTRALQALFAGYFRGSQDYTMENCLCIILGSSFLDREGRLVRVVDAGSTRDAIVEDATGQLSYNLSLNVPDRLLDRVPYPLSRTTSRPKLLPRFHALTAYATIMDLTAANFPWLPVVADKFSPDFKFANRHDARVPVTIAGSAPTYDVKTGEFVDETKDFVSGTEGEVWVNDLVTVLWSGGSRTSGRVVEILDKDTLRVSLVVPSVKVGYAQQGYAGGAPGTLYGYGGSKQSEAITSYSIAARKSARLDVHKFLDRLDSDKFTETTATLVEVLRSGVFLVKFDWEALREANFDGVLHFLDTAKPDTQTYIAFTNTGGDSGLSDDCAVELEEGAIDIEMIPNLLSFGVSSIDGGNPIGASVGIAP